ncbi:probable G-protein coupled receptor 34 [Carcharodon carcharias]|uniref:probable G-protein coupled receptor 34 n=1 Tax=Carcharodon carcharias TaxID=13397 RepID=UPI001B7F6E58|nr:probable G-protein coupled receptor 34 [Carcharodon carcharias]
MNLSTRGLDITCNYTAGQLEKVILPVLYSFTIGIGLPANILALSLFVHQSFKKHGVLVYLANLLVADLINCLALPFRLALLTTGDTMEENSGTCMAVTAIVNVVFYSTLACRTLCIIFISISRYVIIVKYHNSKMSAFYGAAFAKYACVAFWTMGILIVSIPLIDMLRLMSTSESICYSVKVYKSVQATSILFVAISVVFFIILMVFIVFYTFIILYLFKVSKSSTVQQNQDLHIRTQFIILATIAAFIICHLPYYSYQITSSIYRITYSDCQHLEQMQKAKVMVLWLVSFNSCLDPILYNAIPKCSSKVRFYPDQSTAERCPEIETANYQNNLVIRCNIYQMGILTPDF